MLIRRLYSNLGLGKYGKIACRELIGRTYGDTYEILDDGKLKSVKATIEEIRMSSATASLDVRAHADNHVQRRPRPATSSSRAPELRKSQTPTLRTCASKVSQDE